MLEKYINIYYTLPHGISIYTDCIDHVPFDVITWSAQNMIRLGCFRGQIVPLL